MSYETDVIVIGAGAGGAVAAKELGEKGLKVLLLEAGPWYGNKKWRYPNETRGAISSTSPGDLDAQLLREHYNRYEDKMNDTLTGRLRWGPADSRKSVWYRGVPKEGLVWQVSGVGGSTQHYWANSPRAYASSVEKWPISYEELVPYYEKVEYTLPVSFAPTTSKEELFYYGAKKAGYTLLDTLNPTKPGYRPQPNAILQPNERLLDPNTSEEELSHLKGCTLAGHCVNGCPYGPSVDKVAKRSTNVSYIPLALETGNVEVRPNTFTTKIITENHSSEGERAIGVAFRNTWTGETGELFAKAVVMAAGSVENPRLWLNSELPENDWVGRGLTNNYWDWVTGVFDEKELVNILGQEHINPFVGPTSAARLDYPGLGSTQPSGLSPGLTSIMTFGLSQSGFHERNDTWDSEGRLTGNQLKQWMDNYRNTLSFLVLVDDQPQYNNAVTIDPFIKDEHGPIARLHYTPSREDTRKREALVKITADILRKAGAKKIHRTNWPANLFAHILTTMRMGFVVDTNCEAYQVKRLFIADTSVDPDSGGGLNPTLTAQALAARTAEKLAATYFSS